MAKLNQAIRVRVIVSPDNASWILEKMAHRIVEHANPEAFVADVGVDADPAADINHWMSYAFAEATASAVTTMAITHLDDPFKIARVRRLLEDRMQVGICLSSDHRDFLIEQGVRADRLAYVVPAHDGDVTPQRIIIGLTTRLYSDGRKREAMLVELAANMKLDAFRFEIFGSGWEKIIPHLEASGAEVAYFPGTADYLSDYKVIQDSIRNFDYYLYLGRDEGSLGTLDALAAGVKTIVTPQGFHCDLPNGITHAVWSQEDLNEIFTSLSDQRARRMRAVQHLTWTAYAEDHFRLWHAAFNGITATIPLITNAQSDSQRRRESDWRLRMRYLSFRRARSALSHWQILRPIRNWFMKRRKR